MLSILMVLVSTVLMLVTTAVLVVLPMMHEAVSIFAVLMPPFTTLPTILTVLAVRLLVVMAVFAAMSSARTGRGTAVVVTGRLLLRGACVTLRPSFSPPGSHYDLAVSTTFDKVGQSCVTQDIHHLDQLVVAKEFPRAFSNLLERGHIFKHALLCTALGLSVAGVFHF